MKRFTCIEISGTNEWCQQIYNDVKDDIPEELRKRYQYKGSGPLELPLEKDNPSYSYVIGMAQQNDQTPYVYQIVEYTKSEIEDSEYFQMSIHNPFELQAVDNEDDFGTKYEGGCSNPKCRIGKILVGDALADRKLLRKRDIGRMNPGIFVSEKLKNVVCEAGLTGVSFDHEVKDYKGREMEKAYVMDITSVLPPMASSTWLIVEDRNTFIDECGHHNPYLRSDIQYEREKLNDAKDFNLSSEYLYGLRRYQEIVVSAKVRKLFIQRKIRAGFTPVAILD